jgi:hypothetical protein
VVERRRRVEVAREAFLDQLARERGGTRQVLE